MADDPFDTRGDQFSPETRIRRWGMFAHGLRYGGRRRRQATMFLACWLVFVAMIVAILIVVYG
jgi:hypothetical protein